MHIGIIDYGLGNLNSVKSAVQKLGYTAHFGKNAEELRNADKLILPGVGAFHVGMKNLQERNLIDFLNDEVLVKQKPILGICLGFQLFALESEEFGTNKGLGWIEGTVTKIKIQSDSLRIPHMTWNELVQKKESILYQGIPSEALFYYTHSYCYNETEKDYVIGTCLYGEPFVACIQQGNIYGCQFHPEKSQKHGLLFLENFLKTQL